MSSRLQTKRKLRKHVKKGGNWRFRGMLMGALPQWDADTVADVWPRPSEVRKYLGEDELVKYAPSDDTKERHLAESEFGESKVQEGINKDKYIRALLNESHEELDVLWREELRDTVIQGARPFQVARDAARVMDVSTRKGDIPRGGNQTYAPKVAEGAEIPRDEEQFDTVTWNATKYGQGFEVSEELIDHGLVDVIEWNVERAGRAVENRINRDFLNELIDNANSSNTTDTSQSAATVSDINKAIEFVEKDDFGPVDSMVMHPEFKTDIFDDSNLVYANRAGSDEVLSERSFGTLFGAEMFTMSDGTYSGSNAWGFSSDNDYGCVTYNRDFISIQMYRDLEVKDYGEGSIINVLRDVDGGNVRAQFDVNYHQPKSAATITY